ncbi:MAG: flagellar hook capping FlgD N-terminal domain-containing protein [Planctomycetota bacterium]
MDVSALSGLMVDTNGAQQAAPNQELDRDAFLSLLVEQMRNQDPLEPVGNEDFIAQLAQFTSLENSELTADRLGSLLQVEQLGQGAALVGRKVSFRSPTSGEVLPGIVSGAELTNQGVYVDVGGERVPLSNVLRVDDAGQSDG